MGVAPPAPRDYAGAPPPSKKEGGMNNLDWRLLGLALLIGAVGGGTVPQLAPQVVRPDPFTGKNARELEVHLEGEMERRMQIMETRILLALPPEHTRRRIEALEDAVREMNPDWRPPTSRFSAATLPRGTTTP
jgi:hypothetical protein